MSRRSKIILVVIGVVGLLALTLGSTVLAAGSVNGAGSGTICDCDQELRLHHGSSDAGFYGDGVCEAVCQLLDIAQDELHSLRLEGKSLVEIATEKGISEDALMEAIMAVKGATIQEQVEAGILTQEQAELKLQQMLEKTYQAANRTTVGPFSGNQNGVGGYQNQYDKMGDTSNNWGECSEGTGPGDMHQWGKNAH